MTPASEPTRVDRALADSLPRLDLGPRQELDDLRAVVRDFLAKAEHDPSPEPDTKRIRDQWAALRRGLDLQGLLVDERHGGGGFGCAEVGVVVEELGRRLGASDFLMTAVVVPVLLGELDGPEVADLLSGIAAGDVVVGLMADRVIDPSSQPDVLARSTAEGWVLDGLSTLVVGGESATDLVVVAETEHGQEAFRVAAGSAGVTSTALSSLDLTRGLSRVSLRSVTGVSLGPVAASIDRARAVGTIVQGSELVGVAAWCLDASVEYASVRRQFGAPIGSFQAIKHRCADMLMNLEAARSVLAYAVACADGDGDVLDAAAMVGATIPEMAVEVASSAVQVHGGIGFTWEHAAHLYLRRARAGSALFGTADHHRAHLARALDLEARS